MADQTLDELTNTTDFANDNLSTLLFYIRDIGGQNRDEKATVASFVEHFLGTLERREQIDVDGTMVSNQYFQLDYIPFDKDKVVVHRRGRGHIVNGTDFTVEGIVDTNPGRVTWAATTVVDPLTTDDILDVVYYRKPNTGVSGWGTSTLAAFSQAGEGTVV